MKGIFDDIFISCYANCRKPGEPRRVKMTVWLTSDKWHAEQLRIRALNATDEKQYQHDKIHNLPAATMSGEFEYREATGLIQHSGFICLDIDRKDNPHLTNFYELKPQFQKIKNVAYVGWSLSGEGYFILIPIEETKRHAEYFEFFREMFAKWGVMIDKKCGDVSRLRIYSHDPEAYFNHHAVPVKLPPARPKPAPRPTEFRATASDGESTRLKVEQVVETICRSAIDVTAYDGRWFRIALALIDEFGESGREYFRNISQFHPDFDQAECDRKYDYFLKKAQGKVKIGTFFTICQDFGIVYQRPEKKHADRKPAPATKKPVSKWDNPPIEIIPIAADEDMTDYPASWDASSGQQPTVKVVSSPRRIEWANVLNLSEEAIPLFTLEPFH